MQDDQMRVKLVVATIDCLEREGLSHTTVRSIAAQAGVNVAAINYYFGSKDRLIDLALEQALQEAFDNNFRDCFENQSLTPIEALRQFCLDTLEGSLRYPRLTRAFFSETWIRDKQQRPMLERFQELVEKLSHHLKPVVTERQGETLQLTLTQILAVLFFAAIGSDLVQAATQLDLSSPQARHGFVDHLLAKNFK